MSIYIKDGALHVAGAQDKIRQKGVEQPDFFDDYTMIDIETTGLSSYRDRITELGAVKVRRGQLVDKYASLVKYPGSNRVPAFITDLNGITEGQILAHGKPVTQTLKEFRDFIGSDEIAGYNVNFDLNFLCDLSRKLKLSPLKNNFVDVLRLARVYYPREHNRLLDVMRRMGIAQTEAHHGLADSLDTIKVYQALQAVFTPALLTKAQAQIKNMDLTAEKIDDQQLSWRNPVAGKKIVLAGHLQMQADDAQKMIENLGGLVQEKVAKDTNLLLVGDHDFFQRDLPALQTEKALSRSGLPIKAWSESFFLNMLDNWARN